MTHLDDGTLQAFLDNELAGVDRTSVAQHLLGCMRCQADHHALTRANALFTQSTSILDVAPPPQVGSARAGAIGGRAARAGTTIRSSTVGKAAVLVIALAAAASAAVPGSPVREWVMRSTTPQEDPPATVPTSSPAAQPAATGLSIGPVEGRLTVALLALEDVEIRLEPTAGTTASVQVTGARREPGFSVRSGQVDLRNAVGGIIEVRLPVDVAGARLEVDGVPYAESRDGALHLHIPADTVDGALVWR